MSVRSATVLIALGALIAGIALALAAVGTIPELAGAGIALSGLGVVCVPAYLGQR